MLLCCATMAQAQPFEVKGRVVGGSDNDPMPFVNITYNGTGRGTAADIDGKFVLTAAEPIQVIQFSFVGYETQRMTPAELQAQKGVVKMKEKAEGLKEVTVFAKENPAHRIIRRTTANRERNNPENLETFQYETYNKLVFTMNPDSLEVFDDKGNMDTSMAELKSFLEKRHLFFLESVTERSYVKGKRDYEKVLASRVSGFQAADFTLLATQLQSFSLYNDFIEILGTSYLNPISKGSTSRYYFLMQDTVYSGADTVFVVSFRPRPGHSFNPLTGLLYINTADYALQNVVAQPNDTSTLGIRIRQNYEKLEGHWFPKQLNSDLYFKGISVNGATPKGIGRTYLRNIKILPPLEPKDIPRVNLEWSGRALKQDSSFWDSYRPDSLDPRQKETYRFMDSLGKAENFDRKLAFFRALTTGKLRIGVVDFDLGRLFNYNIYEGFRLGVGAELNERVLWWWKPEAYVAYGFADATWKWGTGMTFVLDRNRGLELYGGYSYDLIETGTTDLLAKPAASILAQDYRRFGITQWDLVNSITARVKWQMLPRVTTTIGWEGRRHLVLGDYTFVNSENMAMNNPAEFSEAQLSLYWTPAARMELGPRGIRRTGGLYPAYSVEVRQGLPDLGSDFSYTRLDAQYKDVWTWRRIGETHFTLRAGTRLGETNATLLYAPATFRYSTNQWPFGPVLADPSSFQTMQNNNYLMASFAQVEWRQKLGTLLGRDRKKFKPTFDVIARALVGLPDQTGGLHLGGETLARQSTLAPEQGYYEVGLEINRLFNTLGVGFFYGGPGTGDPTPSFFTTRLTIQGIF
jgi:hypothetical protein